MTLALAQDLFADFFLVTTHEVEFYAVVASRAPQKAPIKSVTHATSFHWFLPAAQFLLLIDHRNTFQARRVCAQSFHPIVFVKRQVIVLFYEEGYFYCALESMKIVSRPTSPSRQSFSVHLLIGTLAHRHIGLIFTPVILCQVP